MLWSEPVRKGFNIASDSTVISCNLPILSSSCENWGFGVKLKNVAQASCTSTPDESSSKSKVEASNHCEN